MEVLIILGLLLIGVAGWGLFRLRRKPSPQLSTFERDSIQRATNYNTYTAPTARTRTTLPPAQARVRRRPTTRPQEVVDNSFNTGLALGLTLSNLDTGHHHYTPPDTSSFSGGESGGGGASASWDSGSSSCDTSSPYDSGSFDSGSSCDAGSSGGID